MSSESSSNTDQPASKAECRGRGNSSSNVPPPIRDDDHDAALESWLDLCQDEECAETRPATSSTFHKPSEGSETVTLGRCRDGEAIEDASSATLRDERGWHDDGVNNPTQKIPRTIVSALLQGVSDVSPPSRRTLDRGGCEVHETDANSDPGDILPRYSAMQKGKWKVWTGDDSVVSDRPSDREESPQFEFPSFHNSVGEWVIHNRPILQDYADRQVSLPLGQRLDVSIDEPSQFILGTLQLLVNRDLSGRTDYSRRLGPQLIENFVDINRWIKEYFRSRHGTHVGDTDVSTLLAIVLNNFYEGQVQLVDRLVEFALGNMRLGGRSSLEMADFAFGFDFRMSQDLPFYVETGAQFRKPRPIRAVEVRSPLEPVVTTSGRQVKPTKRAQESAMQTQKNTSGRRNNNNSDNKDKNAARAAQDKPTTGNPIPVVPPKKKSHERSSADRIVPDGPQVATAERAPPPMAPAGTSYRLIRPSNLRPRGVSPGASSASGTTPSQPEDSTRSQPGKSAAGDARQVPSSSGSKLKHRSPPPHLKSILPAKNTTTTTATAMTTTTIAPVKNDSKTTVLSDPKKSASVAANASSSVVSSREQQVASSSSACTRGHAGPRGRGHGYNTPRGCGHGHGLDRGWGTWTPASAQADNALPAAGLVGDTAEEVAVLPTAVDVPVAPPPTPTVEHTDALLSAGTCSGRPHDAGNGIARCLFTLRLNTTDPSHLQVKKRKLDDCDD